MSHEPDSALKGIGSFLHCKMHGALFRHLNGGVTLISDCQIAILANMMTERHSPRMPHIRPTLSEDSREDQQFSHLSELRWEVRATTERGIVHPECTNRG